MQLCTAALQLSSSLVQHVGTAPKKQRRLAQQKAVGARLLDVVHHQYQVVTAAQSLMIIHTSSAALLHTQLHLSPHYMPYLASLLVVHANFGFVALIGAAACKQLADAAATVKAIFPQQYSCICSTCWACPLRLSL